MPKFSWAVRPSQRPKPTSFTYSPPPASITLPPVTTIIVADDEIGLPVDPLSQERAERAIRAAIAYRVKQDAAVGLPQKTLDPVSIDIPD